MFIIGSLLAKVSLADETYFKFGVGVFNSAKDSRAESKVAAIGHQNSLFSKYFLQQFEAGAWNDSRKDLGRKNNAYASYSVGLPIEIGNFYTQYLVGVALFVTTDSYLGGIGQFCQDVGVGFVGDNGNRIGIGYKHISSAGVFSPNIGRDYVMLKMGVPF